MKLKASPGLFGALICLVGCVAVGFPRVPVSRIRDVHVLAVRLAGTAEWSFGWGGGGGVRV